MELSQLALPLLVSCIAGGVYGILFLLQHRQLVFQQSIVINKAQSFAFFLARILALWVLGAYLLRRELIVSILATVGFISTFWLVLLLLKARFHERT
jgi:hypothetical protein